VSLFVCICLCKWGVSVPVKVFVCAWLLMCVCLCVYSRVYASINEVCVCASGYASVFISVCMHVLCQLHASIDLSSSSPSVLPCSTLAAPGMSSIPVSQVAKYIYSCTTYTFYGFFNPLHSPHHSRHQIHYSVSAKPLLPELLLCITKTLTVKVRFDDLGSPSMHELPEVVTVMILASNAYGVGE
jgi:hypothetical protein